MIARIAGRLEEVRTDGVLLDTGGGLWYEVLVPACDVERLRGKGGKDIVLHTIHYLEGDPSHGQVTPRLLGFCGESDREFFKVFTTVKGIGVRKALRALVRPMQEVATAIQAKDSKLLVALPEIGKRMAERIITELHGKLDQFAGSVIPTGEQGVEMSDAAEEAIAILVQLGERRVDAMAVVERVMAVAPELSAPEEILQQVYKLKAGGV